jgi:SNF2 family DNA or RNA helicase
MVGKLAIVDQLLLFLVKETEEKVILVSHFTSTLDLIESYCKKKRFSYHRLDGYAANSSLALICTLTIRFCTVKRSLLNAKNT